MIWCRGHKGGGTGCSGGVSLVDRGTKIGSMKIIDALTGPITQTDLAVIDAAVKRDELLVMPTDTVYGIASVPFAPVAVSRLQNAKGRGEDFPPPVLVPGPAALEDLMAPEPQASASQRRAARMLAERFWPGALTIIVTANPALGWDLGQTHGTIALRQPDHPRALEILRYTGPLAVTSANLHTRPPATDIAAATNYFGERVSVYVDAGVSPSGHPSTIVRLTQDSPRLLRQGDIPLSDILAALA